MEHKPLSLLFAPACRVCGKCAVRLEIIPPGALPQGWDHWTPTSRQIFSERRDPGRYVLLYEGIEGGNGVAGDPIGEQQARDVVGMISPTFEFESVHRRFYDDLGYCAECQAFYCFAHWSPRGGYGHCPRGHGKSLDPHWKPEDVDEWTK